MNERDSEAVAAQLLARGYQLAGSEATADIVLLNTCSVRDSAEQKALGKMRALAGQRRRFRPGQTLGFLGCMAQSRGRALLDQLPDVDLVIGTQKLHRVADYLDELRAGRRDRVCDTAAEPGSEAMIREHLAPSEPGERPVTAYVSIMQGCNQHCTFCIVPHTRGSERSRNIADIVGECRGLAQRGVKEITLLGQIVTSYGRREMPVRDGRTPFVQLLEAVEEVDGIERVRFTSPHPKGYGEDLIAAYGRLPKLCESAHLPAQSGSDRILRLMHRGYTRGRILELVGKLRAVQADMGVTTDLIVGFPGETEADFEQTLALVSEAQFDNAFVFRYSPRQDTAAAAMPDQCSEAVKEERHARLLDRVNTVGARRRQACIGRRLEVLVEGASRKNAARLEGRTRANHIVVFEGGDRHRGQLLDVRIVSATQFTLYGDAAVVGFEGPPGDDVHDGLPSRSIVGSAALPV
jgi:tRNA-2-methylthio-N6-dimethylallyladenosine synthase